MTAIVEIGEEQFETKIEFHVCDLCSGKGKHVNPSIDAQGLGSEDFAEDPDFLQDYMSGAYDVACFKCNGKRVMPVVLDKQVGSKIEEYEADEDETEALYAAERRMGA